MKSIFIAIICSMLVFTTSGFSQTTSSANSAATEKVKANAKKYFDSKKKVVVVTKFSDKTKGVITNVDDDKFTIRDSKTGATTDIQYENVSTLKKSGGLSTASIVAIAVVGGAAAIALTLFGIRAKNEGAF